jgi:hypothetical protein
MLRYLAGVNEYAVLRIVGNKRLSLAHFLRTIQYLFEHGVLSADFAILIYGDSQL